jgi:hypothetical protein
MTELLQYPILPLGILAITAAYLLLSRGLRKAEATNSEAMRQVHARLQAHDLKLTEHGNKITSITLKGLR